MSRRQLLIYMAALLIINAAYFIFVPPPVMNVSSTQTTDEWELPNVLPPEVTDPKLLIQSGIWGTPPQIEPASESADTQLDGPSELAATEAKILRQRIRAIASHKDNHIVVEYEGRFLRIATGEILPGTDWVLAEAKGDRLLLQKDAQMRTLRLFSEDASLAAP